MKFFRRNPRITNLWDDDLKTDAYYGLSFDTKDDDGTTTIAANALRIRLGSYVGVLAAAVLLCAYD
jgi:hypothetical protein